MSGPSMISDLSAEIVRDRFTYDPIEGVLRVRANGKVAGFRHKDGYWRVKVASRSYLRHRLVWLLMTGSWPVGLMVHRNLIRGDDRWENLRVCTSSQNRANTHAQSNSSHGFKGVTWHNQNRRWLAQIMVKRKRKCLGLYDTPEAAHAAYCEAASKYFGEFARAA